MPAWTNRKVERLCLRYPTASQEDLLVEFAPHTLNAIGAMARRLGVRRKFACKVGLSKQRDWMAIARAHVPTFLFGGS